MLVDLCVDVVCFGGMSIEGSHQEKTGVWRETLNMHSDLLFRLSERTFIDVNACAAFCTSGASSVEDSLSP